VEDSGDEADARPAEGHLADVMKERGLAEWFGETCFVGPLANSDQVALIVGVQILEQVPGRISGKQIWINVRRSASDKSQTDLVQAMDDSRAGQNR
jgi:hypothetical protein